MLGGVEEDFGVYIYVVQVSGFWRRKGKQETLMKKLGRSGVIVLLAMVLAGCWTVGQQFDER